MDDGSSEARRTGPEAGDEHGPDDDIQDDVEEEEHQADYVKPLGAERDYGALA